MRNRHRAWFEGPIDPRVDWWDNPGARETFLSRRASHYSKSGERITLLEWSILFEDLRYRIVAQTELAPGVRLSTVWMGLDHSFGPHGSPPVIFETMDFPEMEIQERYTTEEAARAGHERLLRAWQLSRGVAANIAEAVR